MPLHPSKSLYFESWEGLLQWLPKAQESQLMLVFAWAGDLKVPGGGSRWVSLVRKEAFEQLVQRCSDRLRQFLLQQCGCHDYALAEDVAQQVLIKIYLRAHQYDPKRSFWGWIYRVARNEYIDSLRRLRPGDVGFGQADISEGDWEKWLGDNILEINPPENPAMEKEMLHQLDKAIAALPSLQRAIVRLKREGVTGKDIASQLGISQSYVSQLCLEAGEVLREAIER